MSEPTSFPIQRRSLRLTIVTPLQVVLDVAGVWHVRAEDVTGSFGILPGHADFLTVLAVSVLIYRRGDVDGSDGSAGEERFIGQLRGRPVLAQPARWSWGLPTWEASMPPLPSPLIV